ncbi:MAG: Crp/Fnr family transcriptional regulator [Planctomycetota bacterium]|jgi:toluene monooxygenase system ferredoxin subunit
MVSAQPPEPIAFFGALDASDLELVDSISQRRTYEAGDIILSEGAAPGPLRVLVSGLVSFRQRPRDGGAEATMGTVSDPGEIFGISALVGEGNVYFYTAVCLEQTEVVEVDGDELLALCERKPDIGVRILRRLMEVMAGRLAGAREQIRSRVRPGLISHG